MSIKECADGGSAGIVKQYDYSAYRDTRARCAKVYQSKETRDE